MSATMNPLLLNTILYHLTSAKRRLFAPLLFMLSLSYMGILIYLPLWFCLSSSSRSSSFA